MARALVDDRQAMGAGPQNDQTHDKVGNGFHNANFLEFKDLAGSRTGSHAEGKQGGRNVFEQRLHGEVEHTKLMTALSIAYLACAK